MEICVSDLCRFWGLSPNTVLHVGAHEAEESEAYKNQGWGRQGIVWVEALPHKAEQLRSRFAIDEINSVVQAVAWDTTGDEILFNETNNGQSSSALALKEHSDFYPTIQVHATHSLRTRRLGDCPEVRNLAPIAFVNLDVQGAELRALEGLGDLLNDVQAVYSEVNFRELYEDCAQFKDLDDFLRVRGFTVVDSVVHSQGWGDALWLRNPPGKTRQRVCRAQRGLLQAARDVRSRLENLTSRIQRRRRDYLL